MSINPVSTANGRYYSRIPEQLANPGQRASGTRTFDASLAQAAQQAAPHEDLLPVTSATPTTGGGPPLRMDIDPLLLPQAPRLPAGNAGSGGSEVLSPPGGAVPGQEDPDAVPDSPQPRGPVMRAAVPPPGLTAEEEEHLFAVAKAQARQLAELRERREERAARQEARAPTLGDPPGQVAQAVGAPSDQVAQGIGDQAAQVVKAAVAQIGRSYHPGGASPRSGFDCSGLTNWAYSKIGRELPRSSRDQYQEGTPVPREELKRGDLVFFGNKNKVNHVGVYLSDGQFIHASSGLSAVKISSLSESAWAKLFLGARRHF